MRVQTYPRRTRRGISEYAGGRKSMKINMGLGGVEPPTSRLSATGHESPESYIYIEGTALPPHASNASINGTPDNSLAPRTQRVPRMVNRFPKYRRKRPGHRGAAKTSSVARRELQAASRAVERAIAKGVLVRPSCCEGCGGSGPLQAHHRDGYAPAQRLNVDWLCSSCHRVADQEAKPSDRLLAVMRRALEVVEP